MNLRARIEELERLFAADRGCASCARLRQRPLFLNLDGTPHPGEHRLCPRCGVEVTPRKVYVLDAEILAAL